MAANPKPKQSPDELPESVYLQMGRLLGTPINSESDAFRLMQKGIPTERYMVLSKRFRLTASAVASESTLRRRLLAAQRHMNRVQKALAKRGSTAKSRTTKEAAKAAAVEVPRLSSLETERLMRITRVVSEATLLFGDETSALKWLNTPGDFLHDENEVTPMKLAETDPGARIVEALILRTAHGIF